MAYRVDHKEASETLMGAVVGMLLGDASVITHYKSPTRQAYLQLKHSTKQEAYALYKAELLRQLTHVRVQKSENYDKRTGQTYEAISVVTRCHPFYTRLREAFYPAGHKVIDPFWLERLDERGLALWFLDDGSTSESQCYLATLAFSWPDNYVLSRFIWNRFGIHANVRRHAGRGQPILYIPAKSRQKLREILLPYAQFTNMIYKVPNERPLERFQGDETV